jgi:hypothetical protein
MRGDLAAKLGISPSSGDDDVQPTDVVGTDTDGTPMTMGELAARMNWIYQALLEKGWLNEQLDRIEENTR